MTEMAKTMTFVAVGLVALVAGFVMQPGSDDFDVQSKVGEKINEFDVDDAKRLRIITFDKDTGSTSEFEVAEEDGLWTIPSKQGYPADAVRQMAEAATCLINREVLRIAAESAARHAELGLVDPTSSQLAVDSEGVGTRVTMTNIDGAPLVDMIIGKKVPDSLGQYHVRNADQDVAYVVNLQPEALTTRFEDWIEKDLLKLNPLDIRHVLIKDYTAELVLTLQGIRINWDRRGELELRYDNDESKWVVERLQKFDANQKELVDDALGEDEELNEDVLRELRNGLDDLTIVDVERKPSGLSADLKAGSDFIKDEEAAGSLITRGFAPIPAGEGEDFDILSSEGEIVCTLDDGVEYVLRFGNLQMEGDAGGSDSQQSTEEAGSDDGIHRYLFIMARVNDSAIEKPHLAELPELPEGIEEPSETEEAADEEKPSEDSTVDPNTENQNNVDETAEAEKETTEDTDDQQSELSKLIAERKAIEDENRRLLDEYQEKLNTAKERVNELNERFGDWYYVIDNDVYKKIHLSRDDIIKAKEKEGEENGSDDSPAAGLPNLPGLSPASGANE